MVVLAVVIGFVRRGFGAGCIFVEASGCRLAVWQI